ncbi:ankyrin [Eremomyces bilateralis CBS 781.70]|uniref:Ankyrin n=1 Tax=Eremomyces bilateralis CBS 781.70 TaxID=1392243 RepID=A0A6G1FQD5_9PEZI|nr:ankyrin [Eremomyces bilateralis CBS 781.70]KAF1807899.1 ankyrin [Eremomyces bilateralis CBS 781.70]
MHEANDREVLRWLTQEDPYTKQHQVASKRSAGTGRWFLDSPKFKRWLADEKQTLFCPGLPGSGKTVITSMVVDTLDDTFQADFTIGIAFYYCSFQRDYQQLEELLRSLLLQLGCRMPSLPNALLDLYQNHGARSTRPSVAELFDVLASIVAAMSKVYIVIDALDEMSSSHRRELLLGLFTLQNNSSANLFATSRFIPNIVSRFKGTPSLEIGGTDTESDLIQYMDQRIRKLPAFVQQSPELQDKIKTSVLKASNGMFLPARLQFEELASKRTLTALNAAITSVPEALDELYRKIMRRIENLPQEERHLAKKALSWLTLAERPLKEAELRHALGVEEGSSTFDVKKVPETEDIVTLCEGFVTYGETDETLGLLHMSVYDYLQASMHEWGPDARATVATGCITYLAFNIFHAGFCKSDEEFESRLRNFPLYHYAARHWGNHLHGISPLPKNEICSFLMDQDKVDSASQAMLVSEDNSLQRNYSQGVAKQVTGLHLAAYFGLELVIELLVAEGQSPASKDSDGRTPLWRATEENHVEAMRLLSPMDRTTFIMMLARGEKALTGSLLQAAGPSIRDLRLRTALHIGVLHSDTDIMEQALRCGGDINAKDGDGNAPIQLALQEKKTQAVDWLLNKGAQAADITTENWLQGYGKQKSAIVKLSGDKSGPKEVTFLTLEQFTTEITLYPNEQKRLL